MDIIGTPVVQHLYFFIFNHRPPICVVLLVAVALGSFGDLAFIAPADRNQFRVGYGWVHHVRQGFQRVAVRPTHEGITQHTKTDLGGLAFRFWTSHAGETRFFAHRYLQITSKIVLQMIFEIKKLIFRCKCRIKGYL